METKVCSKCGIEKPIEDFSLRNAKTGARRSECKACHSEYMRQQYHKKKDAFEEYKKECSCEKCGETRFYLLDFHHINPEEKDGGVARLMTHSNPEAVWNEVQKCICLCANCHREFHYLEKENGLTIEEYLK